jgi:hypothetical protein
VNGRVATTAESEQYRTKRYNLDVIVTTDRRVKPLRGIQFRVWGSQHMGARTQPAKTL